MVEKCYNFFLRLFLVIVIINFSYRYAFAQNSYNLLLNSPSNSTSINWLIGGKTGMSIGSGSGSTSAGFLIGPMAEVVFGKSMAVGTELNINTQSGTPIEWADYFKYYFDISGSPVVPYVNGGISLWFVSGGPFFAIRLGGGANFKVAKNLYIPADLQFGPIFYSEKTEEWWTGETSSKTSTIFYVAITAGIRYILP